MSVSVAFVVFLLWLCHVLTGHVWPRVIGCLVYSFPVGSLRIKPPTIIFVTSPFYILISNKLKEIA